jgi:hypothetical protein
MVRRKKCSQRKDDKMMSHWTSKGGLHNLWVSTKWKCPARLVAEWVCSPDLQMWISSLLLFSSKFVNHPVVYLCLKFKRKEFKRVIYVSKIKAGIKDMRVNKISLETTSWVRREKNIKNPEDDIHFTLLSSKSSSVYGKIFLLLPYVPFIGSASHNL